MFLPFHWKPACGRLIRQDAALPIHQMDANRTTRLEDSVQSLTGLKIFISRNVLSATFEAAGLLVFLPLLFYIVLC